jgi:hypothetical protein
MNFKPLKGKMGQRKNDNKIKNRRVSTATKTQETMATK